VLLQQYAQGKKTLAGLFLFRYKANCRRAGHTRRFGIITNLTAGVTRPTHYPSSDLRARAIADATCSGAVPPVWLRLASEPSSDSTRIHDFANYTPQPYINGKFTGNSAILADLTATVNAVTLRIRLEGKIS